MIYIKVVKTNGDEYNYMVETKVEAELFAEKQRAKPNVTSVKIIGDEK